MSFHKAQTLIALATLCVGQRVGVTLDDIVQRFGVSLRTAQRMVVAQERSFPDVGVSTDDFGRKRWRLDPSGLRGLLTVTAEELAALDVAVEVLAHSSQPQEARQLAGLREKVLALMPPNKILRLECR